MTVGVIGNFSILSVGDNMCIFAVPYNLPGADLVGYKREYSCNEMII